MNITDYFTWSFQLCCLSLVFQSIENLILSAQLSSEGVWSTKNLNKEFKLHRFILSPLLFKILQIILLTLSVAGLFLGDSIYPLLLLVIVLFSSGRFRGTINGGSDYITVITLLGLSLPFFMGEKGMQMGLIYIGVQSCLSYCISGLVKIQKSQWRSGLALKYFLKTESSSHRNFVLKYVLQALDAHPKILQWLSWVGLLWESTFPLALFVSALTIPYLLLAGLFHFVVFLSFGLNRFAWAWWSTYPAIYWSAHFINDQLSP